MIDFNLMFEMLVVASVAIGVLTTYLILNKIWTRKSDKNVANSVSIFASILGILSTIPFLIKYALIDAEYNSAIKAFVSIIAGFVFLLIGSGYWVRSRQKPQSLWTKFKKAMKLEKQEAGDLVKAFLMPSGANKMLNILRQLALIDNRIDEKEFAFIDTFAKSWNIPFERSDLNTERKDNSTEAGYIELRFSVADYLNIEPPVEQSTHLRDVMNALAKADKEISEEEKFVLNEINATLDSYANNQSDQVQFEVVIAPQSGDQEDLIKSLLPKLVLSTNSGGKGYVVGSFYSFEFAKMVCRKYRSLNLFTAVESIQINENNSEVSN